MTRPPVNDWASDFDHLDPRWVENPYPIWDELREKCPVAHTERFRGVYFPSRYEDVRAVAYDTENFSSRRIIVRETPPPRIPAPPITSDPPEHRPAKNLLLPAFTPDAIKRYEQHTRDICRKLIERFAGKGGCDAAVDYAQEIPVRVIAVMLGLPESEGDRFRQWIHEILELGITRPDILMKAIGETTKYFQAEVEKRRAAPTDDLISQLAAAKIDGQPISEDHLLGAIRLILIAGIDTTWSAIGSCFWHLAQHPRGPAAPRRRAGADPDRGRGVPARLCAGHDGARGDQGHDDQRLPDEAGPDGAALVPGREPRSAVFPDADRVVIDRKENRHAAFGLGIHRCIGSNLARMEITVALQEWLKRIPDFRLDPAAKVTWSEGTVRGPRQLKVLFG